MSKPITREDMLDMVLSSQHEAEFNARNKRQYAVDADDPLRTLHHERGARAWERQAKIWEAIATVLREQAVAKDSAAPPSDS